MTFRSNYLTTDARRDAADRARVSIITTLFDGKTLNEDNTYIFENVGTGAGPTTNNQSVFGFLTVKEF